MRNILIIILFCLLMAGQAAAEEFTKERIMASWISYKCDIYVEERDVVFIGTHKEWDYFISPYNEHCQYGDKNVWKLESYVTGNN